MNVTQRIGLTVAAASVIVAAGVAVSGDEASAATMHTITIPGGSFTAPNNTSLFYSNGDYIRSHTTGTMYFTAPVDLVGGTATIHSVSLHYRDNGPGQICAYLKRTHLKGGTTKTLSTQCTRNASADIRKRTDVTIKPDTVPVDDAVYLWISMSEGVDYRFYGITIVYSSSP